MERKRALDLLKIIATIFIVFHHYQLDTGSFFEHHLNFYGGRFGFHLMVELFFIISGWCMTSYIVKIYEQKIDFIDFYKKRFLRLFPMVTITAIAYEVLVWIYKSYRSPESTGFDNLTLWGTITDSLLIQEGGSLPNPAVNNPTWYLAVLMICYIVFFIGVWLARRLRISYNYFFVGMIFLGLGIQSYNIGLPFLNGGVSRGYISFFWGLLLAQWVEKSKEINTIRTLVSLSVAVLLIGLTVLNWSFVEYGYQYLVIFFLFPSLIIFLSDKRIENVLQKFKIIELLSRSSFGTFVWHVNGEIMLLIINGKYPGVIELHSRKTMVIFTMIMLVVGVFSYYCIERPINSLISKRLLKRIEK